METLGVSVSDSELADWLSGISSKDFNRYKVRNWYTKTHLMNPLERVLNSQRQCVIWDHVLRKRWFSLCCVVALVVATVSVWLWWNTELWKVAYGLLMAGAFFEMIVDGLLNQLSDILRINGLLDFIRRIERGVTGVPINPTSLIYLQNKLFEHRTASSFVPDWLYKLSRGYLEKRTAEIARTLSAMKEG